MKKRNGQVLILVLLIVVVALAVGLSVASRNITNLRTSTQSEQSQRAFSAAEGGVESVIANPGVGTTNVPVGNLNATVQVLASNVYQSVVEEGSVGQIDLNGASGSNLQIEWVKTGDLQEDKTQGGVPASVEITRIDESGGVYSQQRFAFTGSSDEAQNGKEEGFALPTNCSVDFVKCAQISVNLSSRILRVRPFWNRATIKVTAVNGSNPHLPNQTFQVISTATTELGVTRKIQVDKTALPQLPAAFDYVLYSEGKIEK